MEQTVRLSKVEYETLIDLLEAGRYLGYGQTEPESEMKAELLSCARKLVDVMEPAFCFQTVKVRQDVEKDGQKGVMVLLQDQQDDFGGQTLFLPGESIRRHLKDSDDAVCACLTLGSEVDALLDRLQKQSMLEALLTDALANAAVERLRLLLERHVTKETKCPVNWLFGIGYGDLPIELQRDFLALMQAERKIGLTSRDNKVLVPMKSVTGIVSVLPKTLSDETIERGTPTGCDECSGRDTCVMRKKEGQGCKQMVDKNK